MSSDDFYAIHLRPWLVAGRTLLPRRSFVEPTRTERTMNIAGLQITRASRASSSRKLTTGVVALGAIGATVLGSGVAYAVWSSSGTGSGAAKAGTMSAPATTTVDMTSVTTGLLYPGSTGDVKITVNNLNGFDVKVTAVNGSGTITADSSHSGCTTTGVTFTNQSPTTNNTVAKNSSATLTLAGAVSMDNTSLSACQGATFTIPVSVTTSS